MSMCIYFLLFRLTYSPKSKDVQIEIMYDEEKQQTYILEGGTTKYLAIFLEKRLNRLFNNTVASAQSICNPHMINNTVLLSHHKRVKWGSISKTTIGSEFVTQSGLDQ